MTSSQEPPLTRREMRERERLREQQVLSETPDAPATAFPPPQQAPQPAPPAQAPPPQPAQPAVHPVPAAAPIPAGPTAYAAPSAAAAYGQQASQFGGAVAAPTPDQTQYAPRPAQIAGPPAPATPPAYDPRLAEATTPERTLTRRELRAMLDASQLGELDVDFDDVDDPAPVGYSAPPPAAGPVPVRSPAPAPQQVPVQQQAHAPQPPTAPEAAYAESKPVGHWTSQLNAPVDRAEPFDQMLSRGGVSHGVPTTTNALIMPSLPDHGQIRNPLATGAEIIATGSIDLPRSYGATGVHPSQIDSSDVDRLFDHVEDVGTGVAPVAATRAISTQGASRAMMAAPKKEGMNIP
ncbi:MAG TPA: hypothetical protein VFE99_02315, partial [Agromyces sp.]|nr:hypothetical protein [Agromyces sp.]